MQPYGLGFRYPHYQYIKEHLPDVGWFEFITENLMEPGGRPREVLDSIHRDYPVVLHGVSLSIGSTDPLNQTYLSRLKDLVDEVEPEWISDHLCWATVNAHNSHGLLPMPLTKTVVDHLVDRIQQVQDYLKRPLTFENLSNYLEFADSDMDEADFINEIMQRSGASLLLDINNVYVSSMNLKRDPVEFLDKMQASHIRQIHLAGHEDCGSYLFDTHGAPVCHEVWDLFRVACQKLGSIPFMIERDDNVPEFDELMVELNQARAIHDEAINEQKTQTDGLRSVSVGAV